MKLSFLVAALFLGCAQPQTLPTPDDLKSQCMIPEGCERHPEDTEPRGPPTPPKPSADDMRPRWHAATCETSNGLTFIFEGEVLGGCERFESMAIDAQDRMAGLPWGWERFHGTRIYVLSSDDSFLCGSEYPAQGCTWFENPEQGSVCTDATCITVVTASGTSFLHELFHRAGLHGHKKWNLLYATGINITHSITYVGKNEAIKALEGSLLDRDISFCEGWWWYGIHPPKRERVYMLPEPVFTSP